MMKREDPRMRFLLWATGQCHSSSMGTEVEEGVSWEDDKFRVQHIEFKVLVGH